MFACFSKAILKEWYVNLACFFILLWLEGNISSPIRYSYLLVLPDDNADIFAASLLISYYSFSSPILSLIAMTSLYILFKKLSNARVVWSGTKEYSF